MGIRRTSIQFDRPGNAPLSTTPPVLHRVQKRQNDDDDDNEHVGNGEGDSESSSGGDSTGDSSSSSASNTDTDDSGDPKDGSAASTSSTSTPDPAGSTEAQSSDPTTDSNSEILESEEASASNVTMSQDTESEDSAVNLVTLTSTSESPDSTSILSSTSSKVTLGSFKSSTQHETSELSKPSYASTTVIRATPTESSQETKITDAGPIAGIAIGGVIALALALWCIYKCCCVGDRSYDRRMGRKPVSAFKKRTFWDDIPAPGDSEEKLATAPSTALPAEPQHLFRNQRVQANNGNPSTEPLPAALPGNPPQQNRAPITSFNPADFTTRRVGVARTVPQQARTSGNNKFNPTTAATSDNGQSQWAEVVDEKPLLNPYSTYG